ncbi:hypothetical protein HZB89_01270 [archaeon]|nr:hypothetical protein [archaeon]
MPLQKRYPSTRKLASLAKQLWLERFARKPFDTKLLRKIHKIKLEASRRERSIYKLAIEPRKVLFIKAFSKTHPDMKKHFKAQNLFWRFYLNKIKGRAKYFELKPLRKFFATSEFFVAEYLDKPTMHEMLDYFNGLETIKDRKLEEEIKRIGKEKAEEILHGALRELNYIENDNLFGFKNYAKALYVKAAIDVNAGNYLVDSIDALTEKVILIPIDPVLELD